MRMEESLWGHEVSLSSYWVFFFFIIKFWRNRLSILTLLIVPDPGCQMLMSEPRAAKVRFRVLF